MVQDSGVLDPNSAYLYLLLCRDFVQTCLVAESRDSESILGFVTGYRLPARPDTLFVWQIGVAQAARRQGVAVRLLHELVRRCRANGLTCIEATIDPNNEPSRRLFQSLATDLEAAFVEQPEEGFSADDFPPGDHAPEPRVRIGPLVS